MSEFIKGYENLYSIDEEGRVYSHRKNHYMKLINNGDGYLQVSLSKNGKRKTYKVHRLVAETFIENPQDLPCINHINEIRDDNRAENLEWCTYEYNNTYGHRLEKIQEKRDQGAFDKQKRAVIACDIRTEKELYYFSSVAEASKFLNKSHCNIVACLKGRQKTSYGYKWKYAP